MKRAAIERGRTLRTWKAHQRLAHGNRETGCICDKQAGRFRKGQKQGGCGNSRCYVCHGSKLFDMPTRQRMRADELEREALR